MSDQDTPSISRADTAGKRLRHFFRNPVMYNELNDDINVLGAWRAQFGIPMSKTGMTLRSMVRTATGLDPNGRVIQRQKREFMIVAKMARASTRLSKMEDIAGCRVILPSLDDVAAVADRLRNNARTLTIDSEDDYNTRPRAGGYRALHLHGIRDGVAVEIQLRTERQQQWAESVENWDASSGHDIKHEDGPEQVVDGFRFASEYMSDLDHGNAGSVWANLNKDMAISLFNQWMHEDRSGDE